MTVGRRDFLCLVPAVALGAARAAFAAPRQWTLYIGTHTGGKGQGIFAARFDEVTGMFTGLGSVAGIERPTWLVRDPHRLILYAVSETGNDGKRSGGVYSLAINPRNGTLRVLSRVDSGGGGATYLTYDARRSVLFVANYGDGRVAAIPVAADGTLGQAASIQADYGIGPGSRQKSPHAHATAVAPGSRFMLVPDLGADRVFVYRIAPKGGELSRADPEFVQMPAGTGPRHLVFSQDSRFAFLATELSGEIYTLRWNGSTGRLAIRSRVALDPAGYKGARSAAEIASSRDGRFLYISNRGENLLQVFAIDPATGSLTEVQTLPCGGDVPWSFAIDPTERWLIVADEASDTLAVFAVDRVTGKLSPTGAVLQVPKPVAIAFSAR